MNNDKKQAILHKELDLIQTCITRMSQNSFMIKGWYFALIIVISAWKFKNPLFYSFTLIVATIVFYVLNLQFYIYERRFRDLYSERIVLRCKEDNFVDHLYSLVTKNEKFSFGVYYRKYIKKNKMLIFMYFGICIILISSNSLMNIENKDEINLNKDSIKIEIKGIKSLLNSLQE